jgi:hypothetical protein
VASSSSSQSISDLPEVRLSVANAAIFVAATVCHVLRTDVRAGALAVGGVLLLSCLVLPVRYAAASGLCAWAFLTGFVVNAGGQLTFDRDDLARMLVLVAAGVLGSSVVSDGHGQRRHPKAPNTDARPSPVKTSAPG